MTDANLFDTTDLSQSEQEELSKAYHKGERLDETRLITDTVTQYISILVSAAVVVLIGDLVGALPLLLFFGVFIVVVSLFGGRLISLIQTTKEITKDSTGPSLALRQAFVDACNTQDVNPDKYLLLASDSKSGVAFAFPLSLNPTIVVSTNLLEKCTPKELTSVLSHEIGHYKASFFLNFLFVYLNASLFAIGGAIMWFTSLSTTQIFMLLAVYGIITKILGNVVGHKLEKQADSAVSQENRLNFVRGLIKIQETSYHVEGTLGSITHLLFDEHPPLNHRVESALGTKLNNNALEDDHLDETISPVILIASIIGSSIGMGLIAFGIVNMIASGVGATIVGIGCIINIFSSQVKGISETGFKKTAITSIGIFVFMYIIGYFVGSTTEPIATIGWGFIGLTFGVLLIGTVSVIGALGIGFFGDDDDLEVPEMSEESYDIEYDSVVKNERQRSIESGDIDPEDIDGDDIVIENDTEKSGEN